MEDQIVDKFNGKPTKRFFINMLTRDITVNDAIGDLVDNSVDAARKKIYQSSQKSTIDLFDAKYESIKISIAYDQKSFVIEDNAGGISYDIAKNYAFSFGRPEDFNGTPGSIGQFGIGMKRAFFKLGKLITVESTTENSYFKVKIDVEQWRKSDDWDFEVTEISHDKNNGVGYGTKIVIEELYESTKSLFANLTFLTSLKEEIGLENWFNIIKGVQILVNNDPLDAKDLTLKEDLTIGLRIGRWQHDYEGDVNVRIVCGIGERNKKEDGGWYIFCNDRLIIAHDQTSLTGWGGEGRKVRGGPEYHGQYQLFRGFVFFESQNPSNFPWNTAKTSINPEHPIYVAVKDKMIDMMTDVVSFLNRLKSEKDGQGRSKNQPPSPTEKKLDAVKSLSIVTVAERKLHVAKFTGPDTVKPVQKKPNTQTIKYDVEIDKYEIVCETLGINDSTQVGLFTFNYYFNNEI